MPRNPFDGLVAAAEHIREHAQHIYRCDTCATPKGRWSKPEVRRHGDRKGELEGALDRAADAALRGAHHAGIDYATAEGRIADLVRVCKEWLWWAWRRRGMGAWHNRRQVESEDDYCERLAEEAMRPANRTPEGELQARDAAFVERRAACFRMGQVAARAREERREAPAEQRTRKTQDLPKMTRTAQTALAIIRAEKGRGLAAKEIIRKLADKGIRVAAGTFRKHIVPQLKDARVENDRARGGYYLPLR
jgi:hypothetical protein